MAAGPARAQRGAQAPGGLRPPHASSPAALPNPAPGSLGTEQLPVPLPAWPGAPRVRALGGKPHRDEQRYPQDFSKQFIPTPSHSVAVQLRAEFALGYDVQGSGNEREYFAFEKERDRVCCVKFRGLDTKKKKKCVRVMKSFLRVHPV